MDKTALFEPNLETEQVELANGRGAVTVQALTRAQALKIRNVEMSQSKMERKLLSWAMVDPEVSEDDVAKWQEASAAGEIEAITKVIIRLSGMEQQADKAAYKSAGDES